MKIVFLDFDGVIRLEHTDGLTFDPDCISNLNDIIKATDAKVVISSSWRNHFTLHELQTLLDTNGFIGKIVGKTRFTFESDRSKEISDYIKDNNINNFVVLDDLPLEDFVENNQVWTNFRYGITTKDVSLAISILNKD